jgi:2-polyprenyl-6-methoxyphenol hydroxylase-like FAD-dependent oxidoreductase
MAEGAALSIRAAQPGSAVITTRCAIAGGGPAGPMLEVLLARTGVEIAVLEKHAEFGRDFRGDTVHPSSLGVMPQEVTR